MSEAHVVELSRRKRAPRAPAPFLLGPAPAPRPEPRPAPRTEPLLRDVMGHVLRRARQHQGRTLKHVADEAGVSVPYLSEVERGRKEASSEVMAAICRALGLQVLDLVAHTHRDLAGVSATPAFPTTSSTGSAQALVFAA